MSKKLSETARANRARFPLAAEWLDALKAGGITATVVYAENAAGETIGKRDASPVVDWTLIERIKRWNDRVFGRAVQIEQPKRRNMTDAQMTCLLGDV